MYELINYSEHGTIVDNIVYTLNPITGLGDTRTSFQASNNQAPLTNAKTADSQGEKSIEKTGYLFL